MKTIIKAIKKKKPWQYSKHQNIIIYLIQVCCPHSLVTHFSPLSLHMLQARLLPFCLFWSISDNVPPTTCHLPVSSQSVWSTFCPLNASRTIALIRKEALQKWDFIQRLLRGSTITHSVARWGLWQDLSAALPLWHSRLGRQFKVIVHLKHQNPVIYFQTCMIFFLSWNTKGEFLNNIVVKG